MKLVLEELWRELPQGWVMLRRTPDTKPVDGFIEMHFTGDVNLIEQNNALLRVARAASALCKDEESQNGGWGPDVTMLLPLKEALKEVEHLL